MKTIKSFDVMESFGMNDVTLDEIMEIDGGFDCICKSLDCVCKTLSIGCSCKS